MRCYLQVLWRLVALWFFQPVNLVTTCFFTAEDFSDNEDSLPKEITKWNSNDLMDKIEAADTDEASGVMLILRIIKDVIKWPQNLTGLLCL